MSSWSRYRELYSGALAGFMKRACIVLLIAAFLSNSFAHAHNAHQPAPAALSHQFSVLPDKTGNTQSNHCSIVCACHSTVLPRNCDDGLPVLATAAVKYHLDKGSARRSVRAWDLEPPPRS
jgi:hypothetical protein